MCKNTLSWSMCNPMCKYLLCREVKWAQWHIWNIFQSRVILVTSFWLDSFVNSRLKPNYFKKQCFFVIIFLLKVIIEVQSGNGVLNRLVPCIKCMELSKFFFHIDSIITLQQCSGQAVLRDKFFARLNPLILSEYTIKKVLNYIISC